MSRHITLLQAALLLLMISSLLVDETDAWFSRRRRRRRRTPPPPPPPGVDTCPYLLYPQDGYVDCGGATEMDVGTTCAYHCDYGFKSIISTFNTTTCRQGSRYDDAEWSPNPIDETPPSCDVTTCERLSPPENGDLQCDDTNEKAVGTACAYQCQHGFILDRPILVTTCSQDESSSEAIWSPTPTESTTPHCVVTTCPQLSPPEDGFLQCDDSNERKVGTSCTFQCDLGYKFDRPTITTTCVQHQPSSQATWSPTPTVTTTPQCDVTSCPQLSIHKNGYWQCDDTNHLAVGTSCSYQCDEGYFLIGPNIMTTCSQPDALSSADWSPPLTFWFAPACEVTTCPELSPTENGNWHCDDITGTELDTTCVFQCDAGFQLDGRILIRTCEQDEPSSKAAWSPSPADIATPQCFVTSCPQLASSENGYWHCGGSNEIAIGTSCSYQCEHGFRAVGPTLITTCSRDDVSSQTGWSPSPTGTATPQCVAIICPVLPAPSNGYLVCQNSYERVVGTSCSYQCNRGYRGEGYPPNKTCRQDDPSSDAEWYPTISNRHCVGNGCSEGFARGQRLTVILFFTAVFCLVASQIG